MNSQQEGHPFRHFLLVLLISSGVAFATLNYGVDYLLMESALRREANVTAATVEMIVDEHLGTNEFQNAVANNETEVFFHLAKHVFRIPEVIHLHAYDSQGTKVWCSDPDHIGETFTGNAALERALRGKVQAELGEDKPSHAYLKKEYDIRRVLEVYAPVSTGDGKVYAVIAVYKYPLQLLAELHRARLLLGALSSAIGIALFLALAGIFRKAQRTETGLRMRATDVETQLLQGEKLRVVGEMAATIAHEINNPLGILMGKAHELRAVASNGDFPAGFRDNVESITREIGRLRDVSRNLLLLTRQTEVKLEPTDVNAVLHDTSSFVKSSFGRARITIVSELEAGLPLVQANANQLKQVFLNLLQNAKDAIAEGGTIRLRTHFQRGWVIAEVIDNGSGIAPEIVGRIFDPFFSTKQHREGSGLGLSISYAIIERYGGSIEVASQPGHGSAFSVVLAGLP